MRIVQPISVRSPALLPALLPLRRSARKMRAPSRLPTIYATQPSALRRLLRVLGVDC
jgi:hypothetical protein